MENISIPYCGKCQRMKFRDKWVIPTLMNKLQAIASFFRIFQEKGVAGSIGYIQETCSKCKEVLGEV